MIGVLRVPSLLVWLTVLWVALWGDVTAGNVLGGLLVAIVVVAEGAVPVGGEISTIGKAIGQAVQLGGIGGKVSGALEELTGKEVRCVVLGHLLRGGSPTAADRNLGLRFGAAACNEPVVTGTVSALLVAECGTGLWCR